MTQRPYHIERHAVVRIGWLRASVLGANDGIVSTASLIVGVAAAGADRSSLALTGVAGLVAGAMSMAAGEYVSVSSQADSEAADLDRERMELATAPEAELDEMTAIYVARGLAPPLAREVAIKLTEHDALAAHAREELGISDFSRAKPVQAALSSAAAFSIGAALPLGVTLVAPRVFTVPAVSISALTFLALLGWIGAAAGRASPWRPTVRVTLWGALALAATAILGKAFNASL